MNYFRPELHNAKKNLYFFIQRLFTVNISLSKRKSTEWNIWEMWLSQARNIFFCSFLLFSSSTSILKNPTRSETTIVRFTRITNFSAALRAAGFEWKTVFQAGSAEFHEMTNIWRWSESERVCCNISTWCSRRDHSWRATRRRESPGPQFSTQQSQALWGQVSYIASEHWFIFHDLSSRFTASDPIQRHAVERRW